MYLAICAILYYIVCLHSAPKVLGASPSSRDVARNDASVGHDMKAISNMDLDEYDFNGSDAGQDLNFQHRDDALLQETIDVNNEFTSPETEEKVHKTLVKRMRRYGERPGEEREYARRPARERKYAARPAAERLAEAREVYMSHLKELVQLKAKYIDASRTHGFALRLGQLKRRIDYEIDMCEKLEKEVDALEKELKVEQRVADKAYNKTVNRVADEHERKYGADAAEELVQNAKADRYDGRDDMEEQDRKQAKKVAKQAKKMEQLDLYDEQEEEDFRGPPPRKPGKGAKAPKNFEYEDEGEEFEEPPPRTPMKGGFKAGRSPKPPRKSELNDDVDYWAKLDEEEELARASKARKKQTRP